jgi:hypothetical protein
MKRKDFRRRPISSPFIRPITGPRMVPLSDASEKPRRRTRKIFVIKQARRLASANGTEKKLRRILIFDDHPDTLRLVFGRDTSLDDDLSVSPHATSWEFILVSILALVAFVGMFWPLF